MNSYKTISGILTALFLLGAVAVAQPSGNLAAGSAVFADKCATCHGDSGEGNPAVARALKTTQPYLYGDMVQTKSDTDLRRIIIMGSGKMKPVVGMGDADFGNVISFVRTLKRP